MVKYLENMPRMDNKVTIYYLVCLSVCQAELETQKRHHEAKLIATKEEEKHKMDKMALELELKWTETLRSASWRGGDGGGLMRLSRH